MQAVTRGENEKRLNRLYLEFMQQVEELNRHIDELERAEEKHREKKQVSLTAPRPSSPRNYFKDSLHTQKS